ncbi:hypothetical protein E2562_010517 [Oryza meyeriana var. granulata]|uniref:Late embryogenesis abundant protein LEA-2 subgroup domain-containing protein n=1 Tax=Oryza meyeriana var. granulata TaxID=110450 RepID=A0A6G1DW78_9ORYZ|nr:hypothetical protein E2562_010517 [Oryza meyeriana var. granulata]
MDLRAGVLSFPRFGGTSRQQNADLSCEDFFLGAFLYIVGAAFFGSAALFIGYMLFSTAWGNLKFSMEPVAYTGLGLDAAESPSPLAFNVTLHAKSTFSHDLCLSSATVHVVSAGLTIAKGKAAPFCVEGNSGGVVSAAVSSGWLALPAELRERMDRDRRRDGGVQLEVDLSFDNHLTERQQWVRCRAILDAEEISPCKTFVLKLLLRTSE